MTKESYSTNLLQSRNGNDRWQAVTRPYGSEDVARLRGSVEIKHTLAEMGAERL